MPIHARPLIKAANDAPSPLAAARFWRDLDQWLLTQDPRVARAFHRAIERLQRTVSAEELDRIIAQQDMNALANLLDLSEVQLELREIAADSAVRSFAQPPLATFGVRFDLLRSPAVAALSVFESRALASMRQDLADGVLQLLNVGLTRGWGPAQTARLLRPTLGLPARLQQAVANYRTALEAGDRVALQRVLRDKRGDGPIRRAIEQGKAVDPRRIEWLVDRYQQRAQRYHSENVARTASMDAANTGNRLAWQQIIDAGKVDIGTLRRFWIVAGDERTCPLCLAAREMNRDGVGFDEPFQTPNGPVLIPSLHWSCRCSIWTKIVEY